MELLSIPDREAKTRRQLALVDTALTNEFATLPASVVHREVATVSDGLIANARFTDHVAVLTGRFAADTSALPCRRWSVRCYGPTNDGTSAGRTGGHGIDPGTLSC
jgi:hypothetical protein